MFLNSTRLYRGIHVAARYAMGTSDRKSQSPLLLKIVYCLVINTISFSLVAAPSGDPLALFALEEQHKWNKFAKSGMRVWSDSKYHKRAVIEIYGQIPGSGLYEKFVEATKGRDSVTVILNSSGGNTFEAEKVAHHLHRLMRPRFWGHKRTSVSTYVAKGGQSQSAATIIFLATPYRNAHPEARIGIHASNVVGEWYEPATEAGHWLKFGLPQSLATKILDEGLFTPGSPQRLLSRQEIVAHGVAVVGELAFLEDLVHTPRDCAEDLL